ncbi:MAG: VOC family protein [Methylocystis sp.]|uniref:VOC family protein n=1 Tax=Methylocystis sp. TaxID=1911079 RepID=UPI003DA4BB34
MADQTPATHGVVCWSELNVHDVARAQQFYAETLGWRYEAMTMPDMTYWIILSDAARVGGMFEMKGAAFEGAPEHWMTYIAVDDVDARLRKAVTAGARICKDAFDIPGVGRMAVLAEPGGAIVAWMTPRPA